MKQTSTNNLSFEAKIEIIGINPFVFLPDNVLQGLFDQSGKSKGKIPVRIKIDGHAFTQTLVKYSGHWRLYLNEPMRKAAQKEVGDTASFEVAYNPMPQTILMHPKLSEALESNPAAREIYNGLAPSLKKEIVKYISFLKTPQSVERNVERAINLLLGKERFIGRDKPK